MKKTYRLTLPLDLSVNRHYRIYLNVPDGSERIVREEIFAAVMKYIETNGLDDADLDLELPEIEESDINGIVPDWDGAWPRDEGGI